MTALNRDLAFNKVTTATRRGGPATLVRKNAQIIKSLNTQSLCNAIHASYKKKKKFEKKKKNTRKHKPLRASIAIGSAVVALPKAAALQRKHPAAVSHLVAPPSLTRSTVDLCGVFSFCGVLPYTVGSALRVFIDVQSAGIKLLGRTGFAQLKWGGSGNAASLSKLIPTAANQRRARVTTPEMQH